MNATTQVHSWRQFRLSQQFLLRSYIFLHILLNHVTGLNSVFTCNSRTNKKHPYEYYINENLV